MSLVKLPPLGHAVSREDREIDGRKVQMYPNWVAPDFFTTMNIPMVLGRSFYPGEKNAVIVSQSLARRQWPGQNPVGKPVGQLVAGDEQKDIVVGVAGDARINALSDDDAVEQYWPMQQDDMPDMTIIVRTAGASDSLPPVAKTISESLDAKLFPEIRQVKMLYHENIKAVEQVALVVSLVGLTAVSMAGIGIIGLVAFTVSQRTKEIAIRLALGARPAAVLATVLRQFSWPVALGLLAGTGFAAAGSKVLRKALFGVSNLDPAGYAGALCVLALIVIVAALLPARRALRLDLAKILHYE